MPFALYRKYKKGCHSLTAHIPIGKALMPLLSDVLRFFFTPSAAPAYFHITYYVRKLYFATKFVAVRQKIQEVKHDIYFSIRSCL